MVLFKHCALLPLPHSPSLVGSESGALLAQETRIAWHMLPTLFPPPPVPLMEYGRPDFCSFVTEIAPIRHTVNGRNHSETMRSRCLLVFAGESSFQGSLGGAGFCSATVFLMHVEQGIHLNKMRLPAKRVQTIWSASISIPHGLHFKNGQHIR